MLYVLRNISLWLLTALLFAGCKITIEVPVSLNDILATSGSKDFSGTLYAEIPSCYSYEDSRQLSSSVLEAQKNIPSIFEGAEYEDCFSKGFDSFAQFKVPVVLDKVQDDKLASDKYINILAVDDNEEQTLSIAIPQSIKSKLKSFEQQSFGTTFEVDVEIELNNDTGYGAQFYAMASYVDGEPYMYGIKELRQGEKTTIRLSDVAVDNVLKNVATTILFKIGIVASGQDIVEAVQRGDSLLAQGQPKQALAEYEKARELGAGSAMFLNRLASLYMQTGGYSQAAESLQQSLAEDPRQLPVYSALGEAFLAMGQLDSSIFYVEQASILAPSSTKVHSTLGYLYMQGGQRERARERLDRALSLDEKNPEAYRLYGYYYAQQDSVDRAIEYYQKLAELSPENVEAYNNIAFLLAGAGRYPEALEYYKLAKDRAQDPYLAQAITAKIEEVQALLAGEMRARYILVETEASALEVLKKIAQGADFSQLAQQLSIAPNASQGGDLGFFGPGELMPEIEEIVVQLKVGELSQVVELPMGYIVVQRLN